MNPLNARRLLAGLLIFIVAGCGTGPVEPTLPPVLTDPPRPATASPIAPTLGPTLTLPPTWTQVPTQIPGPTVTLPPSDTPPPATATLDLTAQIPIAATSNGSGATVLTLTEAQLNAALAEHFDAAPLLNYTAAPRVTLVEGSMAVTMLIVPIQTSAGSSAQTMTLMVNLDEYDGALEVQPVLLAPLGVGVSTRQVKMGQALLLQTLNDVAHQASGATGAITYTYVSVHPDGVSLTVVVSP